MSGTHLVAGDYRWGKNPLRSFPNEHSPATSRWGYLSPATCRWGKARQFARERGDCIDFSGLVDVIENIDEWFEVFDGDMARRRWLVEYLMQKIEFDDEEASAKLFGVALVEHAKVCKDANMVQLGVKLAIKKIIPLFIDVLKHLANKFKISKVCVVVAHMEKGGGLFLPNLGSVEMPFEDLSPHVHGFLQQLLFGFLRRTMTRLLFLTLLIGHSERWEQSYSANDIQTMARDQVFSNVPCWYFTFYGIMSSLFMTQRTKRKFVFLRSSTTAETIFKHASPGHVPIQYGGMSVDYCDCNPEFTID
ncbi:CRAL-TRIO domain-containing protein [Tanacetum coccineum]